MILAKKIADYATRRWAKSGMTEHPTVRDTARALRITQKEIEEEEGQGLYCLEGYYCEDERLGDRFIYPFTKEADQIWEDYLDNLTRKAQ